MNVIELLEATKAEVGDRWVPRAVLYDAGKPDGGHACLLGCVGFARWENFGETQFPDEAYASLREDPLTGAAIEALAKHSRFDREDPVEQVYRQNDSHFINKQHVKDFIDLALADLKSP